MSLDKSSMKTRSQSTVEQNDPALVPEVIKDILQSKSFLSLVEESITNRVKEMEETIEKANSSNPGTGNQQQRQNQTNHRPPKAD